MRFFAVFQLLELIVGFRIADRGEQEGFLQVLLSQHLTQNIGVPAGRSGCRIVAGIGDDRRLSVKLQRHFQRFFRLSRGAGIMEFMTLVPDIGRQLIGNAFSVSLILSGGRNDNDAAACDV